MRTNVARIKQFGNRILNRLRYERIRVFGTFGEGRINRVFPQLNKYDEFVSSKMSPLKPAYNEYISLVSTPDMAVSWESSCFMYFMAQTIEAKSILDLGSGFSSFVARAYARDCGRVVFVHSVDDSDHWLQQTRTFLDKHGVDRQQLSTWNEFQSCDQKKYDLIFHDLGSTNQLRAVALPLVLEFLNEDGVVILDDMHKPQYRLVAIREIRKAGLNQYSARRFTLDGYKRFAEVATGRRPAGDLN